MPGKMIINKTPALISVLSLISLLANSVEFDQSRYADLWTESYNTIFGPTTETLTERQLFRSIWSLQTEAKNLDTISDDDKHKVDFWFGKVFGFTVFENLTEYCTVDHVERIIDTYQRHNVFNNPNFEQVLFTFRRNIIEFCDRKFADLPLKFSSIVHSDKLIDLVNTFLENKYQYSGRDLLRVLTSPMLERLGIKDKTTLDAWYQGPCGWVLSTLQEPGMKDYSNFVEMSLFEGGDFLGYCSKPVFVWVNIIKMCRTIGLSMSDFAEHSDPAKLQTAKIWERTFSEIFKQKTTNLASMSEKQLSQSLKFLNSQAQQLALIDETDRATVNLWHSLLTDFRADDCKLEHLETYASLHEQQNPSRNPNFKQIYESFVKNMIEFCDGHFSDLHTRLAAKVYDGHLLNLFQRHAVEAQPTESQPTNSPSTSPRNRLPTNQRLVRALTDSFLKAIESGKSSEELTEAWDNSPCGMIMAALQDPEMKPYSNFVHMSLFGMRKYLKYCSASNQVWIKAFAICKHIDKEVPTYIASGLSASSVRLFMKLEISTNFTPQTYRSSNGGSNNNMN